MTITGSDRSKAPQASDLIQSDLILKRLRNFHRICTETIHFLNNLNFIKFNFTYLNHLIFQINILVMPPLNSNYESARLQISQMVKKKFGTGKCITL